MRGFITFSTHLVLSEQTTQSLSFLPGKKKILTKKVIIYITDNYVPTSK